MASDEFAALEEVLVDFVTTLANRLDGPHALEDLLRGESTLSGAAIDQRPEAFTENHLIYPLLSAADLAYEARPYGEAGERVVWPDFRITNLSIDVIGENKSINKFADAEPEIKEYLDRKSIGADYGIATDGFQWAIFKIELGGDITEYPAVAQVDLRPAIVDSARQQGLLGTGGISEVDSEEILVEFSELFSHNKLETLLSQEAPRIIRDERKRDVEEFYELYIELLFGESEEYDYDTSLMDDIRPPDGATERDVRLFAITLVNRLLFIKFLESRGVLSEGFLRDRVQHYERNKQVLVGNLYDSQIKPLFYKLLNTPPENRDPKFRVSGDSDDDAWFAQVPYLNGGLFRENIPDENDYTVIDRILPTVVSDLIEGSELELNGEGFDPAVLGAVFEKTINHIEQEREQKDIGAYYTPNDVTDLINKRSVDPKVKDTIVDIYSDHLADDDQGRESIRNDMANMELSEILRSIEDGAGWFGSVSAAREAFEELSELKVIDPACGSGHFLTSAMDEIFRVQVAILRGLNRGEDPDPEKRFEVKRDLALNAIYGVDVDRIATEIAKLRVWLKIVEGNSWEPGFGQLPNIDVNIAAGNSLVGLPIKGTIETADIWGVDLDELASKREAYKFEDEGDRQDIESDLREIRPAWDTAYLDHFNRALKSGVDGIEEFNSIIASIEEPTLYPSIETVKFVREDGDEFTESDEEQLESLGYSVYKRSARLDIQQRESEIKNRGESGAMELLVDEIREALSGDFTIDEIERRPLDHDLDRILGTPFHWPIEFPEVVEQEAGSQSIHFDIVVGNPPYGDLLGESEKLFTSTFTSSSINEISAQFVERQLQLLQKGGYFGNVTTLRLVYQSSHPEFQQLLRDNFQETTISCFGLRGRTGVFDNALIRVSVMTGQKDKTGHGDIDTSDLILFTESNRQQRFKNIDHSPVDGLILGSKIGEPDSTTSVLPKVGSEIKRKILLSLKGSSGTLLRDTYSREPEASDEHIVWKSGSGGYWINPMLEEMYDATDLDPLYFESELHRRTAFLILSSSLYYLYWVTYGNQRNHSWFSLSAFPWPDEEHIQENEQTIQELSTVLWTRMKDTFQKAHASRGRFVMSPLRPIIDDVDALVGNLFELTDQQINYTQGYHTDVGEGSARAGTPDTDLSYERMFPESD